MAETCGPFHDLRRYGSIMDPGSPRGPGGRPTGRVRDSFLAALRGVASGANALLSVSLVSLWIAGFLFFVAVCPWTAFLGAGGEESEEGRGVAGEER